jgi:hypothetical protein
MSNPEGKNNTGNISKAHMAALKWAIDEAESWNGSMMPGSPERLAHEKKVATAREGLKRVKAQLKEQ